MTASATSGLDVTLAASGGCTLSGSPGGYQVQVSAAGLCRLDASQGGNASWAPAMPVTRDITVAPKPVTLSWVNDGQHVTYDALPHTAEARVSDPAAHSLTVTYDGNADPPTDTGNYQTRASLGDPNYAAAAITGTLIIDRAPQIITFRFDGVSKTLGEPDFNLSPLVTRISSMPAPARSEQPRQAMRTTSTPPPRRRTARRR